jgi:hypothetical protein
MIFALAYALLHRHYYGNPYAILNAKLAFIRDEPPMAVDIVVEDAFRNKRIICLM